MSTEEKIRTRKSYRMFKNLYKDMQRGEYDSVLLQIHRELDSRSAFGSQSAATWALESAMLVLEDFKQVNHEQEQ